MPPILKRAPPTSPIRKELVEVLSELEKRDPDVLGSVIMRSDGLIVASALREDIDRDLVAAMCTSLLSVSQRVLQELNLGDIESSIIRGKNGIVMTIEVVPDVAIAALAKKDANLGLLYIELRRAADKIKNVLAKM